MRWSVDNNPVKENRLYSYIYARFLVPFLYKSNILYVREVCRSGYGITGTYGKPATLMEGG